MPHNKVALNFSVDMRLEASPCCECGKLLTGASGPCQPSPDDMTLCLYCGSLNVFDVNLRLRRPTDAEFFEAAKSPVIQALHHAIIEANKDVETTSNG